MIPTRSAAGTDPPWIRVRRRQDGWQVTGSASFLVGHDFTRREERPRTFCTWNWDGRRLVASNDRFGFHPFFYFASPSEIALSTSVTQLLALGASTEIDDRALAVFLRIGFFIGDDTPFRAIRAMPPGADFRWEDGRLHLSGAPYFVPPQQLSRAAVIDGYMTLFRESIAKRLPRTPDVAVPLSGGRDSRHILFELLEQGVRPAVCVTYRQLPPKPDDDAEVAACVIAHLDLPHVILPQPPNIVGEELDKNVLSGFCTDEHVQMLPLARYLADRVSVTFDGIAGDVLSAGVFVHARRVDLYARGRFDGVARHMFERYGSERLLARALTPEWYGRLSGRVATDHVVAELAQHANAANPITSFFFWNRTRRAVALSPYALLARGPDVIAPFLDDILFDFLSSLPPSAVIDRQLHTETIRRTYRRWADLSFERSPLPAVDNPPYYRSLARRLARYALTPSPRRIVRRAYLLPRLLARSVDGDGARLFYPLRLLYLLQLERVCGGSAFSFEDSLRRGASIATQWLDGDPHETSTAATARLLSAQSRRHVMPNVQMAATLLRVGD